MHAFRTHQQLPSIADALDEGRLMQFQAMILQRLIDANINKMPSDELVDTTTITSDHSDLDAAFEARLKEYKEANAKRKEEELLNERAIQLLLEEAEQNKKKAMLLASKLSGPSKPADTAAELSKLEDMEVPEEVKPSGKANIVKLKIGDKFVYATIQESLPEGVTESKVIELDRKSNESKTSVESMLLGSVQSETLSDPMEVDITPEGLDRPSSSATFDPDVSRVAEDMKNLSTEAPSESQERCPFPALMSAVEEGKDEPYTLFSDEPNLNESVLGREEIHQLLYGDVDEAGPNATMGELLERIATEDVLKDSDDSDDEKKPKGDAKESSKDDESDL